MFRTAFQAAAGAGRRGAVKLLLEAKANANAVPVEFYG